MEEIIPMEISVPKLQTEIPEKAKAKAITKDLDMTYELHEAAAVRSVIPTKTDKTI